MWQDRALTFILLEFRVFKVTQSRLQCTDDPVRRTPGETLLQSATATDLCVITAAVQPLCKIGLFSSLLYTKVSKAAAKEYFYSQLCYRLVVLSVKCQKMVKNNVLRCLVL